MGSVTYENTQLTRPNQPPTFTVIQVSRCDNYTLDWCVQPTRLREMESKKQCVLRDLGLGSRDRELREIGSSKDR